MGRGNILSNGIGSGGGHGGKGGDACYNDNCVHGGISYGSPDLPCELGSGSGNGSSTGTTAGGGIIGKLMLVSVLVSYFFNNGRCLSTQGFLNLHSCVLSAEQSLDR